MLTTVEAADARERMRDLADKAAYEQTPFATRCPHTNTIDLLAASAERHADRTALAFQLKGDPKAPAPSMTYREFWDQVIRCANGLIKAGVKPGDTVALLLPNLPETMIAIYAAQAVGAVAPINPLLEPEIIGGILAESEATTLITLAPFLKTDVSEKAAEAVALAPNVKRIVEIDLLPYLGVAMRPIAALLRPKRVGAGRAEVIAWKTLLRSGPGGAFAFERTIAPDDIGAYFHTGGTTGNPKLAMHNHRGMVQNASTIQNLMFDENDVILSALPLFHVFSSYVMALAPLSGGSKVVLLTPQGFRGDGVMDNFWKLIERWKATFLCGVPTAIAALDQRPVNADVSSLRYLISGSAPLPQALFERFQKNTGVKILEGYGMTEGVCVTSCNPPDGVQKVGSVGFPLPYIEARICDFDDGGRWVRDLGVDEVGEICFRGASIFPGYKDASKSRGVFFEHPAYGTGENARWLKTGDLGRVDADGYIWITGRAKDLIIRGGHNIDPGLIEEALAEHPDVAFVGAIGQPDAYSGELPCAYVELRQGATVTPQELKAFADERVAERAARPAVVSIVDELPKTAVGKIFKPALRKEAIARVFSDALQKAGLSAEVEVEDDQKLGLVAVVRPANGVTREAVGEALNGFARPWRLGD